MARGGGDRSREDDPFSDGGTTGTDSDESSPRGVGARGPGSTSNPILTRLAVSRNPSPLAAATAAPGVCLLRFAWESAAGSLVGAAVGYGFMAHRCEVTCGCGAISMTSGADLGRWGWTPCGLGYVPPILASQFV
ncbi:Mitochondrial import inner membrane translocase subunit TIM22-2 [Zea mays]|uniref:Mitochondrial import inner membrane translocase subunit TIM22-2 n=1 Tax=Zea mays TaxID=4577 RepID=A0A1D6LF74_MAIZE|nr:Mitochondrial import inner membrane translocase subunit TIM22-2 [Zea mays]